MLLLLSFDEGPGLIWPIHLLSRVHDLLSRARDLLSRVRDLLSHVHDLRVLSHTRDLLSHVLDFKLLSRAHDLYLVRTIYYNDNDFSPSGANEIALLNILKKIYTS